jgi:metal-responsive CopG/Arc/MetJ family transcriptional regulator
MKTAVSIPDPLFAEAGKAARELNISRSKLVQTALEEFLEATRRGRYRGDQQVARRVP